MKLGKIVAKCSANDCCGRQ